MGNLPTKNSEEPYKMMKEVEHYLIQFATENQIPLVGSYNPENLPLDEGDFLDGMHFRDTVIKKIFNPG